jgi:prepilin-type processing-associated H-X9-DG protein
METTSFNQLYAAMNTAFADGHPDEGYRLDALISAAQGKSAADSVEYDRRAAVMRAIERRTGAYLADENIDRENVVITEDSTEFWTRMLAAQADAAGMRAEEAGLDINALLGFNIY